MIDIAAALKKYLDALGETPPKKKQLVSAIMDEQVAPWQVSWFKTAADATDIMDFIASIKAEQADNFRAHSMAHEIKQQTNLDGEIIVGWIFEGCGVDNPFGRASDPTAPETVLGQQVRFPQQVASETKLALSDGEVYEGEVRDGQPHGKGKAAYPDGSIYDGNWAEGQRSGHGTMTYASGCIYAGEWLHNKRHGQGRFTRPNGGYSEGEFKNDVMNGYCVQVVPGDFNFKGYFRNDVRHGKGTYTHANGDTYEGEYRDGKRNGHGVEIIQSGKDAGVFEGEWLDGSLVKGSAKWSNGKEYNGQWSKGFPHGYGRKAYPSGGVYEGEWAAGERHGRGKYVASDGTIEEGVWDKGKLTTPKAERPAERKDVPIRADTGTQSKSTPYPRKDIAKSDPTVPPSSSKTPQKGQSIKAWIATLSDEKRHAWSILRRYDVIFNLVYSYFIVSMMPCADILIGRLMVSEGESRTLSEIIGISSKAAIIAFWFIFWISFMFISAAFSRRVLKQTGKISEEGNKRLVVSFLLAFLGLLAFVSSQATDTICMLYDELRSFFSIAPIVFGIASLFVFFIFPYIVIGGIRKYRAIFNAD